GMRVGVVPPGRGAGTVTSGAAALICDPAIRIAPIRSYARAGPGWKIERTFVGFVVAQAVGMDAVRNVAAIQEVNENGIPHLRTNDRSQNAKPTRLWLANGKPIGCVRDIAGLVPGWLRGQPGQRPGMREIASAGSVVPAHIFGGNEVMPGSGKAIIRHTEREDKRQDLQWQFPSHLSDLDRIDRRPGP